MLLFVAAAVRSLEIQTWRALSYALPEYERALKLDDGVVRYLITLHEHEVVFFRDQKITPAQQIDFIPGDACRRKLAALGKRSLAVHDRMHDLPQRVGRKLLRRKLQTRTMG